MSRMIEHTAPSGLRVKLRSVKGRDLDGMSDKLKNATGESWTKLLDDCTVELIDRGIYTREKTFTWADALVGDRLDGLIAVRMATGGPKYDFRAKCQDPDCRQWIDWEIDLENDIERQPLPEESKQVLLAGDNDFITELNGHEIHFKLTTGRDQMRLSKLLQQINQQQARRKTRRFERDEPDENNTPARSMVQLGARISRIEGVDEIVPWLEEQDLPDIKKLVKSMDKYDCGVETTIEIQCTGKRGCGLQQEIELPLDKTFFAQDG